MFDEIVTKNWTKHVDNGETPSKFSAKSKTDGERLLTIRDDQGTIDHWQQKVGLQVEVAHGEDMVWQKHPHQR